MKNSLGFICRAILFILLALSLTACGSGSDGENVSVGSDNGNSNGITDDHGNSIPFSTPISRNDNVNGNIETGGDVDYFSFRATNGKTYTIETTIGTLDDTVISLYNEINCQIDSHDYYAKSGWRRYTELLSLILGNRGWVAYFY